VPWLDSRERRCSLPSGRHPILARRDLAGMVEHNALESPAELVHVGQAFPIWLPAPSFTASVIIRPPREQQPLASGLAG
jgi:hypothetical protein